MNRLVRHIARGTAALLAIGMTIQPVGAFATSPELNVRASFLERFTSLAASEGGTKRAVPAWDASTGISQAAWKSALADPSVLVDYRGNVLVVDPIRQPAPFSAAVPEPATKVSDIALADAFTLNSLPESNRTIYLDFTGHSLSGTIWQDQNTADTADDYTDAQMDMPAFNAEGDGATFSNAERQKIIDTWSAVAEDFAPYDVNITTQDPGLTALARSGPSDQIFGVRAVITDFSNVIGSTCGCGGIAYMDVFDYPTWNTYLGPALAFADAGMNGKTISDIVTHEVGHNLGLSHDGIGAEAYYTGRDGWAPIMGAGYYVPLVQFSNGTYTTANQGEDDFAIMAGNGISLRADDHADTRGSATSLTLGTEETGVVSTSADVDYFSFVANDTSHDITVTSPSVSANLDVQLKVYNSAGTLVSTTNPDFLELTVSTASGLDATVTASTTAGETYYVSVEGVGFGAGTTTGYSDYGSVGEYAVLASGAPTPILTAGTPTISGTGVYLTSLTGSTGTWPEGSTVTAEWYRNGSATGNTTSTYTILSSDVGKTMTYRVSGSKSGYTSSSASSTGVTIQAATITGSANPTISGTAVAGSTLTGDIGNWSDQAVSIDMKWYRDGSLVASRNFTSSGLMSRILTSTFDVNLTGNDVGHSFVFRTVATKAGYTTLTKDSSAVVVGQGTISPTTNPTVRGTAKVKKTLAAVVTGWMSGVSFTYQWLRNGSPIASATRDSYKLAKADAGKRISVRVTGSATGFASVSTTSAATGKVKK